MTTKRFPIKIHRIEEGIRARFKAATALERAQLDLTELQKQLQWVELDYELTISAAQITLTRVRNSGRKDARVYWYLAGTLEGFLARLEMAGFYFDRPNLTFARDLALSQSTVRRVRSFYKRFPDPALISQEVLWNHYRNSKSIPLVEARP